MSIDSVRAQKREPCIEKNCLDKGQQKQRSIADAVSSISGQIFDSIKAVVMDKWVIRCAVQYGMFSVFFPDIPGSIAISFILAANMVPPFLFGVMEGVTNLLQPQKN